eukprot:4949222-Amphidinium_carterae.1
MSTRRCSSKPGLAFSPQSCGVLNVQAAVTSTHMRTTAQHGTPWRLYDFECNSIRTPCANTAVFQRSGKDQKEGIIKSHRGFFGQSAPSAI